MVEVVHAIEGVHERAGARLHGREALLIGRRGVADCSDDGALRKPADVLDRPRPLGRERALADEAVRLLLPRVQRLEQRIDEVLGVLRTLVLPSITTLRPSAVSMVAILVWTLAKATSRTSSTSSLS